MKPISFFLCWLLAVNLVTFFCFGVDKQRARKHKWRIPERTLLLLSVIGGSIGALSGMQLFHHKTLHKKFTIGVPVILGLQIAAGILFFLWKRGYV